MTRIKIIAATENKGKLEEIAQVLGESSFEVVPAVYADMDKKAVAECGSSYSENALIKAWNCFCRSKSNFVIADDSGIEIDYFNGWPGIYSSRFAGADAGDGERNAKVIRLLDGIPSDLRKARFVCAVAVYLPDGAYFTVESYWYGMIAEKPEGCSGFGYDPVFFDPAHQKTAAQMDREMKNAISHRGQALVLMKRKLEGVASRFLTNQAPEVHRG